LSDRLTLLVELLFVLLSDARHFHFGVGLLLLFELLLHAVFGHRVLELSQSLGHDVLFYLNSPMRFLSLVHVPEVVWLIHSLDINLGRIKDHLSWTSCVLLEQLDVVLSEEFLNRWLSDFGFVDSPVLLQSPFHVGGVVVSACNLLFT